jgi:hypothetical protein
MAHTTGAVIISTATAYQKLTYERQKPVERRGVSRLLANFIIILIISISAMMCTMIECGHER